MNEPLFWDGSQKIPCPGCGVQFGDIHLANCPIAHAAELDRLRELAAEKRRALDTNRPPEQKDYESTAEYFRRVGETAAERAKAMKELQEEPPALDPREETISALPKRYRWARFNPEHELVKRVRQHACSAAFNARDENRVVFIGPAGSGKTSLAVATLRARYLDAPACAHFVSCWRLGIERSINALGRGEASLVERAMEWAGVVLLDDLGNPARDPPMTAVPDVILERHDAERPTWVTTWMTPDQVEARYGAGVARRIFEGATIIDCGAKI